MSHDEKNMEELHEGGLILDENTISEKDFLLGGSSDLSVQLEDITPDQVVHFYNQAAQKRTRNGCTNYAAFGCVGDMNGHRFVIDEILDIHDKSEGYGWDEQTGNYLYKAVDCMRDYWNENNSDDQIISFRVDLLSPEAQKLIEGGKSIMIGYRTSREHIIDSQDNGNLDSESFKEAEKTGGHAIRYNSGENIDNYIGRKKHNTYTNDKLMQYVREGTYFRHGYVFFRKETGIFKDLPKNHPFYNRIKSLHDRGFIKGYPDGTIRANDKISRGESFLVMDRICEHYDGKINELMKKIEELSDK